MADPLQVVRSLETLADQYAVFEADQVLTHDQLNSVSGYLDDQDRLTRVDLLGVGVVSGLRVRRRGDVVRISRGLGVTTDGDLLRLPLATEFDRFRPYDATAPRYAPFYRAVDGEQRILSLHELVPAGAVDPIALPLTGLPAPGLAGKVVLMLMESVVDDPDLCTGADCDNLGRDALQRVRFLLIDAGDAAELVRRAPALRPASERARKLPEVAASRPALGRDVATTGVLAARYWAATKATIGRLLPALDALAEAFPEVFDSLFGADVSVEWRATLKEQVAKLEGQGAGIQVWYDFVKDVVETYGEAREALLRDDSAPMPDVAAFPKHLLLGRIDSPGELVTQLHPSALDASARDLSARVDFALRKLHALIRSFAIPDDASVRVTPSRGEHAPLEERAIPWHYRVREDVPIHESWNRHLASRGQSGHNLGYRAAQWGDSDRAREPLKFAIGGNDFFRVEGHLGRPVLEVRAELQALITASNLPFEVHAVLVHADKRHVVVKPPFRFDELQRLHYLLRKDVELRIDEGVRFGDRHLEEIRTAVANKQIADVNDGNESPVTLARDALDAVVLAKTTAAPALASRTYSGYGADAGWKATYKSAVDGVAGARVALGSASRSDFTSAFDSLISTNHPHWLDWVDELISAEDVRADERLLFSAFVARHPGIDHLGGVWRGGTFVLAYDDRGRVVADFTVPYPCAPAEVVEPEEPPLKRPPYRGPMVVAKPVRLVRPVKLDLDERITVLKQDFAKDLVTHTSKIQGVLDGMFLMKAPEKDGPFKLPPKFTVSEVLLDEGIRSTQLGLANVEEVRRLAALPGASPADFAGKLKAAYLDLSTAIQETVKRAVDRKLDVADEKGAELTKVLTGAIGVLKEDTKASTMLMKQIETLGSTDSQPHKQWLAGLSAARGSVAPGPRTGAAPRKPK